MRLFLFWGLHFLHRTTLAGLTGKEDFLKNRDMTAPAIETHNLTKEYPHGFLHLKKKTSLEVLTMQVEDGEAVGFLGPNGAGKSTTIKLLMGILFPTAGSAQILGKTVSDGTLHSDMRDLPN